MAGEAVHPLRAWREGQLPKLTLDAAAAAVGTVRQVWRDWEIGRRIPSARFMTAIWRFTRGDVVPNDFYDLPPIGQMALPFAAGPAPLLDHADAAVSDRDNVPPPAEDSSAAEAPPLTLAA
jgi:hypothetical protein